MNVMTHRKCSGPYFQRPSQMKKTTARAQIEGPHFQFWIPIFGVEDVELRVVKDQLSG